MRIAIRLTLNFIFLGYIGIVWPKEHSPEVSHIPPVTPCMYVCVYIYIVRVEILSFLYPHVTMHSCRQDTHVMDTQLLKENP
jgi:hypothetical protein